MKYGSLIAVFLGATLWSSSSRAVTSADFFCSELPQTQPAYYGVALKNCGNGQSEALEGICTQTVFCAYVNADVKAAAKEALKKDFSSLSDDEKSRFLKGDPSVEWLPTILTCKGKKTALGALCPAPEQCKGDIFYKMQPAFIAPDKFQELQQRQIRGSSRTFQAGPSAGVTE